MLKPRYKVITAVFDIKPVCENGAVDFEKISRIQPVLNLGRKFRINKNGEVSFKNQKSLKNKTKNRQNQPNLQEELEKYLNEDSNSVAELVALGAKFSEEKYSKPRYKPIVATKFNEDKEIIQILTSVNESVEENYKNILAQINLRIPIEPQNEFVNEPKNLDDVNLDILTSKTSQSPDELNMWVEDFSKKGLSFYSKKLRLPKIKISKPNRTQLLVIGFGLISLPLLSYYGLSVRNELIIEGNSAIANLENARENIKNMDFVSASNNFAKAYQEFLQAGDNMNFMGAEISSLLSGLPGASKLKSAKNLIEAGKLIANAGQAMSDAMSEIAKTNLILNPLGSPTDKVGSDISIGEISTSLKKTLTLSKKNLGKAKQLLADVDDSSMPEDKKESFEEFKSKLPLFEKLINDSVDYSKFLEDFIGTNGSKKYLILFQNPSELRPTGGFPGTYGVVSFKDGKLQDFKVDDVYNLDGQFQELIIPPLQLQHITPNWGMRDANWFIDFPTSARKIAAFFKKESGYGVDGVITFSPQIVAHILDIVGPVEMPEYNLTLDSKNLFSALQEEVEYKADRKQPKQIIVDLAPLMLKKLYSAESGKWLEIFNVLVSSMDQKDILMYFRDLNLESFSIDKGFSGKVADTDSDYLMVTLSNIKGSKTDMVVDSFLKVETMAESGSPSEAGTNLAQRSRVMRHKVSVTRIHNGGNNKHGFYNKKSSTYVRVLVPENAEFVGLTGNSRLDFKPLIDYANSGFKKDEDLAKFEEESYTDKETGVTIYKEAGKTEFGFWMMVNPGETKTVGLEYLVPSSGEDYKFYVQKQPSLDISGFKFYMDGKLYFDGPLDKDMVISPR